MKWTDLYYLCILPINYRMGKSPPHICNPTPPLVRQHQRKRLSSRKISQPSNIRLLINRARSNPALKRSARERSIRHRHLFISSLRPHQLLTLRAMDGRTYQVQRNSKQGISEDRPTGTYQRNRIHLNPVPCTLINNSPCRLIRFPKNSPESGYGYSSLH